MNGGGVFGALIFVVGILALFALMFGFFLIVPFFVFLAGLVWVLVSDRGGRGNNGDNGNGANGNGRADVEVDRRETVEVVETTTEVREIRP